MLLQKFNIDTEKIKRRNKELIEMKIVDKLNNKQKKFINWYKGHPTNIINNDGLSGYTDISNYYYNSDKFSEISIKQLENYMAVFNIKINELSSDELKKVLNEIQNKRIKNLQKYIKIGDTIFTKGIISNDIIYRIQAKPIEGNIIKTISSWSLYPINWFCDTEECHLYITKIPKIIKVMYLENDSKDKNLKTFQDWSVYEFEYLLPRNIEFVETKIKKIKIKNNGFISKNENRNKFEYQHYILHYIKIIKKHKNTNIFPKSSTVKLIM